MKKNIAVIGAGYWGQNLIRNFFELEALKYIYDENKVIALSLTDKYSLDYKELDVILSDQDIEGIVIATPASTHFKVSKLCLQKEKHVFVEKPITLNVEEAEELVALAEKKRKQLMIGHLLQYHNHFIEFKKIVLSKKTKLLRLTSLRKSFGKIRDEENVLWSFAPHDISMINSLISGDIHNINKLSKTYFNENVDAINLHFQKGPENVLVDIEVDWTEINKVQKITAYFEDEIIVFEDSEKDTDKKLYRYSASFTKQNLMTKNLLEKDYVVVQANNPLRSECNHFLECIRNNSRPNTDGVEALEVLKALILLDKE